MGLVGCLYYIPPVRLIEEELFVQFEVSNLSSDVQKLFSLIMLLLPSLMYKTSYEQREKNKQNSMVR